MSLGEELDNKLGELDLRLRAIQSEVDGIKALLQSIYNLFIKTYGISDQEESRQ